MFENPYLFMDILTYNFHWFYCVSWFLLPSHGALVGS